MTVQVPVRLTEEDTARLDELVEAGRFANRSDALRTALKQLLKDERDREIEEAYRRGYGEQPQEEWIGEWGLALLAAWDENERREEASS